MNNGNKVILALGRYMCILLYCSILLTVNTRFLLSLTVFANIFITRYYFYQHYNMNNMLSYSAVSGLTS